MTLSITMSMAAQQPQLNINTFLNPFEVYSDARTHGYQGETRKVRLARVTPPGGGAISKSEDGTRCVVTGKETLRILRVSDPASEQQVQAQNGTGPEQQQGQQQQQHKYAVGKGGYRIDASRNFWEGSGLKIDSASTDVAWGHGVFNNKILTSARNGELILWDLNKSGGTKYERRTKDHIRSIHKLSVSHVVHHYCVTGSADGHLRVWDLRDLSKSIMRVHHPTSVRSLVFSPSLWQPLQAVVGLDNGSIYRWDLKMGQRGLLDRLPVAHTASVTALDWCSANVVHSQGGGQADAGGLGWIVSGGLDRCVKVWDLTAPGTPAHIPQKPTYTLHPSFAVRRLAWRPGYECELAVVSNTEYSTPSGTDISPPQPSSGGATGLLTRVGSGLGLDSLMSLYGVKEKLSTSTAEAKASSSSGAASGATLLGDTVEIWDVRRGWLAKWSVTGSSADGGVTDIAFNDSHALWTQHASGSFAQFDLRETTMPIDSIPRVATAWDPSGSMTFVVDKKDKWEVPYDDIAPEKRAPGEITKLPPDPPLKALGNPKATITTQSVANYDFGGFPVDVEAWSDLARGYVHEGMDRREICAYNAGLAFDAGHTLAGQAWLLLGAALAQYVPDVTPPSSPLEIPDGGPLSPGLAQPSQGYSFPASSTPLNQTNDATTTGIISPPRRSTSGLIVSPNSPAAKLAALSASSTSLHGQVQKQFSATSSSAAAAGSNLGGGMGSGASSSGGATPQPLHKPTPTPTSSTSPSPRQFPGSLPPSYSRRASFFGRPDPIGEASSSSSSSAAGVSGSGASAGGVGGGGVPGSLLMSHSRSHLHSHVHSHAHSHAHAHRRPSIAASSPGDRSVSMSSLSLRQVGEGVLDDSDSEDEEEDRVLGMTDDDSSESESGSDEEGVVLVQPPRGQYRPVGPLLSPGLVSPVNGWPGVGASVAASAGVASGSGMASGSGVGVGGVGGGPPAVGLVGRGTVVPPAPSPLSMVTNGSWIEEEGEGEGEEKSKVEDKGKQKERQQVDEEGEDGDTDEDEDEDDEEWSSSSSDSSSEGGNSGSRPTGDESRSRSSRRVGDGGMNVGRRKGRKRSSTIGAHRPLRQSGLIWLEAVKRSEGKSQSQSPSRSRSRSRSKSRSRGREVAGASPAVDGAGAGSLAVPSSSSSASASSSDTTPVPTPHEEKGEEETRGPPSASVGPARYEREAYPYHGSPSSGSVRTVTRALVGEMPGSLGRGGGAFNSKAGGGGGDGERRREGEFEAIGLGLENGAMGEKDEAGREGREEGTGVITPKSRTASSSSVDVLPGVSSPRPVSALIRSTHLITGEGDTERITGSAGRSPIESDRDVDRKWGDEDDYQTERAAEVVEFDESVFRERTLSVLMDALEEFADEGDVQTCALLALVAPEELKVSRKRLVRFVNAYIEVLTRLRLHTCAAYLGKYRKMDEVVKPTLQNTIIYTSCTKCRKPLVVRAGKQGATKSSRGLGAYSLCEECDSSVVKCCICQLPVRIGTTPLFHCAVCNHGGHEACYKQYYTTTRLAVPPQSAKSTATTTSSSSKKGRKKKKKQTSIGSGVLQRAKLARKRPALEVEEWDEEDEEEEEDEEHAEDGEDGDEDDEGSEESDHGAAAVGGGGGGDKLGVGLALAGQPCAAGCGHHCWAGQGKKGEKVGMVKV